MKKLIALFCSLVNAAAFASARKPRKRAFAYIAAGVVTALSGASARADLLLYEPFDYTPVGTNITGLTDPYSVGPKSWASAGTPSASTVHQIGSGSLTGPGGFGGRGNMANIKQVDFTEYERIGLPSTQYDAPFVLYYSVLLNVPTTNGLTTAHSNANANNNGVIAFNNNAGSGTRPNSWAGELVIKLGSASGTFNLGVRGSTTVASTTYFSGDLNTNQTYLVVVSYNNQTAGSGGINSVWINPDPSTYGAATAPAADGTTTGNINAAASLDHVSSLIIGAGIATNAVPNDVYLDEIRVGTTWADVTVTNVPSPSITSQPKNQRAVAGGSASFSVTTVLATLYQWQHNNVDLPGATQRTLSLTNVTLADAGSYRVNVSTAGGSPLTSSNATLTVFPDIYPRLVPLWSVAAGTRPYLDIGGASTPNVRSFAYNSSSNTLLVVSRLPVQGGTNYYTTNAGVFVLSADTGADLYGMNTNGISGGYDINNGPGTNLITLNCIDVAADGAVYACNVGTNATLAGAQFTVYRWDDSGPAAQPVAVYQGDPSGQLASQRFGDTLAVRGSGTGTEIMVDNGTGTFGSVLTPSPSDPVNQALSWQQHPFSNVALGNVNGGRTLLYYGSDATFWEKHGSGNLLLLSYDLTGQTSTILTNIPNVVNGPNLVDFTAATNMLFAIDSASTNNVPDTLDQYDLSDPSNPLFVRGYNYPINHHDSGTGRVIVNGDRVYALDSNNGLVAFRIAPNLSIMPSGGSIVIAWSASTPGYTLYTNSSLSAPNWGALPGAGILNGQQYLYTNSTPTGTLFYQLRK